MGKQGRGRRKRNALAPYPYKFRGLVLDDFQAQAIMRLRQGTSTLVAAPTGTGKTLIADYLVDMCLQQEQRIVYTGPIKALVSQKYRNFKQSFGKGRVGIMTGDISINPDAPVVVMTTEIFRNMLLQGAAGLKDVAWVIFDEIHYLDHEERGAVWEEAIMLMSPGMRLLGLSATIPNAKQIGAWIEYVHQDPTAVIEHHERAVPLVHLYFNQVCQAVPRESLLRSYVNAVMPGHDDLDTKAGALDFAEVWNAPRVRGYRERTSHLDVISYVASNRLFPCIYFVFSRRLCQQKATELARRSNFLSGKEREIVRIAVKRTLEELHLNRSQIPEIDAMEEQWRQGIAIHHAGLLPAVKRIVEVLLERKVLRVVYATETFAVGVNMPVRSVFVKLAENWITTPMP
jgi:superfamily II RNA helicase